MSKRAHLSIRELEVLAYELRQDVIQALVEAKSGHSAGPLGTAEIFASLYFSAMNIDPKKPTMPERDRFVLSNAHICPILYATLARRGFCDRRDFLKNLRKIGHPFQGHSNNHWGIGIETCGGPLGQGVSQAVGMALYARQTKQSWRTYLMTGDGELDEGQCWEGFMLASKERLNNLTLIVDRNNIQIDGFTEKIMPLEPLADKFKAFGWHVISVDGHNVRAILDALKKAETIYEKPTAIIAHTIPGKGVHFMERDYVWHGKPPNPEEAKIALKELRTLQGRITSEHE
jgi:transketolase